MTLLSIYLAGGLIVAALALWWPAPRLRAWPLLALAALPQLLIIAGVRTAALALLSAVALALWGWQNRRIAGIPLAVAGGLLNLGTMLVHGGAMPVHPATLAQIGVSAATGTVLVGSKDLVADLTLTALLGDWIIIPLRVVTLVVSPGDLLVLAGIALWLLAGRKEPRDAVVVAAPGPA